MRTVFCFLLSSLCLIGFAQFNNPYRIAYDGGDYLVTNKGSGNVVRTGASTGTDTVITGLFSPNDILFGEFSGNSAIVVIDSNIIKIYDPQSYQKFYEIDIIGAIEAHDAAFNPANPEVFYISDKEGNKIIKGTIGPAPLFPVSFSNLSTGIPKPGGMIFDQQGRLLVVSDTIGSQVYAIDTVNGNANSLLDTNLDHINDIAQDNEGNYYMTCWGDHYLYRFDDTLGNPKKIVAYSKPSGMFANLNDDLLVTACYNCNKIEYNNFHLFTPSSDISTCPEDSIYIDFNLAFRGIGTYNSGNKFIAELSDSNGSFANPVLLAEVNKEEVPSTIRGFLPRGDYANAGYKYRLRSTSPAIMGYSTKSLQLLSTPKPYITSRDTMSICTGVDLNLGEANNPTYSYDWSPGTYLSDSTSSDPIFKTAILGTYNLQLKVVDHNSGCSATKHTSIIVDNQLVIPLADSLAMCIGDSVSVGVNIPDYFYSWSGSPEIDDPTLPSPLYFGDSSVFLYVIFSDQNLTCSGRDSVYVKVNPLPQIQLPHEPYQEFTCIGEMHRHQISTDSSLNYYWTSDTVPVLHEQTEHPIFSYHHSGTYPVHALITDPHTACSSNITFSIEAYDRPDSALIEYSGQDIVLHVFGGDMYEIQWYKNGVYTAGSGMSFPKDSLEDGDSIRVQIIIPDTANALCELWSNTLLRNKASISEIRRHFNIMPNPTHGKVEIHMSEILLGIAVTDQNGRLIYQHDNIMTKDFYLDMSEMSNGIYFVKLQTQSGTSHTKILRY